MKTKITKKVLDESKNGDILAQGMWIDAPPEETEKSPHLYINGESGKQEGIWVAVRGHIGDWAIYLEPVYNRNYEKENGIIKKWSIETVKKWGNKVYNEEYIKKLVDVESDEVFNLYRH